MGDLVDLLIALVADRVALLQELRLGEAAVVDVLLLLPRTRQRRDPRSESLRGRAPGFDCDASRPP